ncbi:MAG: ABC transporter substrate-binding protein [Planctomycetes bacterium]|nr:ABC transporter substrate-binding protein [Planctomycetota bacterium]
MSGCSDRSAKPLRVGVNPWPGCECVTLADDLGFYGKLDLPVEIVRFAALGDSWRAFQLQQVDAVVGTGVEILTAHASSGRRPIAIRVLDASEGADVIFGSSAVSSLKDLRGKRVALEPGTLNGYLLSAALTRAGLTWGDIKTIPMAQVDVACALQSGTVDAVVTYPPFSADCSRVEGAKPLFSSRSIPGEIVDILAVDAPLLETDRPRLERLLAGITQAQEYIATHREDAYRRMAVASRMSLEDFRCGYEEGLQIISASEQEKYLGDSGSLSAILARLHDSLRQQRLLEGNLPEENLFAFLQDARVASLR